MGRQQKAVDDPFEALDALARRVAVLETSSQLGKTTARGGTTQWADDSGNVDIWIGVLPDGSRGIKIGATSIVLKTDGTVSVSGAATVNGDITTSGKVTATGDLSTGGRVVAPGGVNTGDRNFKFTKTSSTRLDIATT